ncbi:conserved hypothetical protein [Arcobacter nitrofigilis DSM 7299]|uniref:Uncharacterized protein n=1 Tax=Arcobacter nitrofigilis (strain ATCC 33309 / DSM 7299 / CCUG 15893 / LMG 7604 / NCTC 12251 / CI) TaxID=572480 RepID=D5V170_ARCNC|nr:hypothetical protein [Arcobacter nitrofigilis]ADG94032.1 conserved hypothetical protein [Arcobacter nitrofigilis DSM 7299]
MQIEMSPEVVLSQLGYSKSESALKQAEIMIKNTKDFEKFAKHIISLNDHLKKMNAYVGFSNKTEYLKIKCDENDSDEILKEFHNEVSHWADKYGVEVQQISERPIYYILGVNN